MTLSLLLIHKQALAPMGQAERCHSPPFNPNYTGLQEREEHCQQGYKLSVSDDSLRASGAQQATVLAGRGTIPAERVLARGGQHGDDPGARAALPLPQGSCRRTMSSPPLLPYCCCLLDSA